MKANKIEKPATVRVRIWNTSVPACADADGYVRVWDSVAEQYTVCHSLTESQVRYVRARVMWGAKID